jgi:orotidine-5'-phosphate decarboxylase
LNRWIQMTNNLPIIFCAIDTPDIDQAIQTAQSLQSTCGIKLGMEFFNAHGPQGVQAVMDANKGTPLFLDLKYKDIPNTVAGSIRAVTQTVEPAFLNVHADGGAAMMRAAKAACPPETKLLAVTILTSIDPDALDEIGQGRDTVAQVRKLALLAQESGLDGVVCSSHEIEAVRAACGDDFILMVPGIRPEGSAANDQKRIMTPKQAKDKGATHLVIGRPITQSESPAQTAQAIVATLTP